MEHGFSRGRMIGYRTTGEHARVSAGHTYIGCALPAKGNFSSLHGLTFIRHMIYDDMDWKRRLTRRLWRGQLVFFLA
jgi:hypothetical protein